MHFQKTSPSPLIKRISNKENCEQNISMDSYSKDSIRIPLDQLNRELD